MDTKNSIIENNYESNDAINYNKQKISFDKNISQDYLINLSENIIKPFIGFVTSKIKVLVESQDLINCEIKNINLKLINFKSNHE